MLTSEHQADLHALHMLGGREFSRTLLWVSTRQIEPSDAPTVCAWEEWESLEGPSGATVRVVPANGSVSLPEIERSAAGSISSSPPPTTFDEAA